MRVYKRLAVFSAVVLIITVLDKVFGNSTSQEAIILIAFFLTWANDND